MLFLTGFHARDPDPTLRKTEKDILIPKIMRDRSRLVVCKAEVDGMICSINVFLHSLFMVCQSVEFTLLYQFGCHLTILCLSCY